MKYYKHNSIPLEEDFPGIGEISFDQYGNMIELDSFEDPMVLSNSVLTTGSRIDEYIEQDRIVDSSVRVFLKGFWALTNKQLQGYAIQDTTE